MLVLTRRAHTGDGSTLTIGDDVEVTVLESRGDQVRIGISAPHDVSVHRKEVWLEVQNEAEEAAALRH